MPRRVIPLLPFVLLIGCAADPSGDSTTPPDMSPVEYSLISLPSDYDGASELSLIIVLHEAGTSPGTNEYENKGRPKGLNPPPKLDPNKIDQPRNRRELQAKFGVAIVTPSGPVKQSDGQFDWSENMEQNFARVNAMIAEVGAKAKIRKDRIVLFGFSEGGATAFDLARAHPEVFAGAIAIAPSPSKEGESAGVAPSLAKRGFVLCYGDKDEAETIGRAKERLEATAKAGAKTQVKELAGVGHEMPRNVEQLLVAGFEFVMSAGKN